MKGQINFKIHMKANIAKNLDESFDTHELIKCLLMRILNRQVKRSTIASEQKIGNSEETSDVSVDLKDGILHYEIQKTITKEWSEKIKKREIVTIPIPIKEIEEKLKPLVDELRKYLIKFAVEEK